MSKWDDAPQALSGARSASYWAAALLYGLIILSGCAREASPIYETLTLTPAARPEPAPAKVSEPLRIVRDIESPRALAYDSARDELLVGVMIGESFSEDRTAFIMRLSGEGDVLDPRYLEAVAPNEPLRELRDLAIDDEHLYVLESRRLLIFSRAGLELLRAIEIEGARALSAIALGESGELYLVDRGLRLGARGFIPEDSDAIYRVDPRGGVEALIEGAGLGRPSALAAIDGELWIVSFGSGELYRLSAEGELVDRRSLSAGSLDDLIALPDGRLAIASWEAKAILIGERRGAIEAEVHGVDGPTALAFDERSGRLFIALRLMNELRIFSLEAKPEAADQ